jgi:mono/diheme cytochrome c family protein
MQLSYGGAFWSRLQVWLVAFIIFLLLPVSAIAGEIAGSGNYKAGKAIFTGETRLKNGGPPCISCHNAGVGALGGGSLGPDLTKVWAEKSFFINADWINSDGIPVMGPTFSGKDVTPEEVADLQAFFSVQAEKSKTTGTSKFVGGGIIGFIALIIAFSIIWGGRYRNRCQGTAHDALWRNYGGKGGK